MLQFKLTLSDGQYLIINQAEGTDEIDINLYDEAHEPISKCTVNSVEFNRMARILTNQAG